MHSLGFETVIPASKLPQTYALDGADTQIARIRSPDSLAHTESLHQLRHSGSCLEKKYRKKIYVYI